MMLYRATLRPLLQAQLAAKQIASGHLGGLVGSVRERSISVAASIDEVASGSGDLPQRTELQAATLQRTTTAVPRQAWSRSG